MLVASLDRLPAELLELLERHRVAIVATAEGIDTATPAGRLALAEARRRGDSSPAGKALGFSRNRHRRRPGGRGAAKPTVKAGSPPER